MNTFERLIAEKMKSYPDVHVEEGGHTIGAWVCAVMSIKDEETAWTFYEEALAWMTSRYPDIKDPDAVTKSNIGWCFGEGMKAEMITMWRTVCGASRDLQAYC